MSVYTEYHPRWIRRRMSTYWWIQRGSYLKFILRELSSLFVAWFVVYLLLLARAMSQGTMAYHQFFDWAAQPLIALLNVVTLLFLVFHSITWFNLAPQAMVVRVGRLRVPDILIAASNYVAWVVVTALVAWGLLAK